MSNKTIRMCDSAKTNDYMEKSWIMNLVEELFVQTINEQGITINLYDKCEKLENNYMEYFKAFIKDRISEPTLLACFSRGKDKLSQWRVYADNGSGIAIGFDLEQIKILEGENIIVKDVVYDKYSQNKQILSYIKENMNILDKKFIKGFDENSQEKFIDFCQSVAEKLN